MHEGVEHVSDDDRISTWAYAHIASCPRCAVAHGAVNPDGVLPFAWSVAEAQALLDAGHEAVVVFRTRFS